MSNALEEIRIAIEEKKVKIGVVGLGYVGLPLAVEFAAKGFQTLGIDLDSRNYYLEWLAKAYDFQTNFISLAAEVNENMPFYVRNMVQRELSFRPVSFKKAKILILGVAFKKDVDDTRHSPALKVMELLLQDGATNISYNDPFVPSTHVDGKDFKSVKLTPKVLRSMDCVLITTDHSSYDYEFVVKHSKCIVDARNATRHVKNGREKIVLLGDGK